MKFSRTTFLGGALIAAVLLVTIAAVASPSTFTGQWYIEQSDKSGQIHIGLRYERHTLTSNYNSMESWDAPLSAATGLTQAALDGSGSHGQFRLVRDAGTFVCDGWLSGGKGSGTFSFEASQQFAGELKKRGVGDVTEEQQFRMAMANVSLELVDTLKAAGYQFDSDELIRTANHGVSLDYIKQINALGYHPSTLHGLIRMRDHGVSAEYVKAIQSSGLKGLSEDEIVRLRDHGVSAEYIHGLAQYGITDLSAEALTRLRDHGVDPEYIAAMRAAGFKASAEELTRMRDHGVDQDYVRSITAANITDLTTDDLVRMRDHGVDPEFIVAVRKAGLMASASEMARMRDHGVSANFIAETRAAGFTNLSPSDLMKLRDHGVDADYLKRHGKDRSIEDVIRMHDRGGESETL